MRECPTCHGVGAVTSKDGSDHKCSTCSGTGDSRGNAVHEYRLRTVVVGRGRRAVRRPHAGCTCGWRASFSSLVDEHRQLDHARHVEEEATP